LVGGDHRRQRLFGLVLALTLMMGGAGTLATLGRGSTPDPDRAASSLSAVPGLAQPGSAFPGFAAEHVFAAVQLSQRAGSSHASAESRPRTASSALTVSSPTTAQSVLVGMDFPAGVSAPLPGNGQEAGHSVQALLLAFALAVFLVYLVTASQVESLLNPLSILFTVPMGLIAATWGLYATGATLNAVALIGTILLAGILVNNALVLIEAIRNARVLGKRTRDAMIEASRNRVRPIMITAIGTVLGLLPMAIGVGEGLAIRRPTTLTVVAGAVVATFLAAVALPVLRALLHPRLDKTT
jgi:multidrug efflux pump subunit AcrB